MKEGYVKRQVFPYLATVLNHSRYNGEGLDYVAEVKGGIVKIIFEKEIAGNYFHVRYEKAKALMKKCQD